MASSPAALCLGLEQLEVTATLSQTTFVLGPVVLISLRGSGSKTNKGEAEHQAGD